MCSIVEDEFENEAAHSMIEDLVISDKDVEICKKCRVEKVVITLNLKDGKCQNCFLAYVAHKFRSSLGSSKVVQGGADVLLSFDGCDSAVCLLHIILDAAKLKFNKKLHFNLNLVYIDENLNDNKSMEEVKKILIQFGPIKCHYARLGSNQQLQDITDEPKQPNNTNFLKVLNDIPSLSAKQEFVSRTKTNMLHQIANMLNCKYIFVADIGNY